MNNKLEKYINYIVNDLVKNMEIDYVQETIKFIFPSQFPFYILFITNPPLSLIKN